LGSELGDDAWQRTRPQQVTRITNPQWSRRRIQARQGGLSAKPDILEGSTDDHELRHRQRVAAGFLTQRLRS
jgi:hypothetical protein